MTEAGKHEPRSGQLTVKEADEIADRFIEELVKEIGQDAIKDPGKLKTFLLNRPDHLLQALDDTSKKDSS
jgi:hypothetical protein